MNKKSIPNEWQELRDGSLRSTIRLPDGGNFNMIISAGSGGYKYDLGSILTAPNRAPVSRRIGGAQTIQEAKGKFAQLAEQMRKSHQLAKKSSDLPQLAGVFKAIAGLDNSQALLVAAAVKAAMPPDWR